MLNSRILGLIWRGRAYFVVNKTTIFLPGEWRQRSKTRSKRDQRASCQTRATHFWRQIKSLKKSNVQISPLLFWCLCLIINEFSCWKINVFSGEKRCQTLMADWYTNFPQFQAAQPDHVQVESSIYCCPRALESFVRPRALDSFDQWHVTRSPPIRNRIWVGRYNNEFC